MTTISDKLAAWAIKKIEAEFKDDVCLLIKHDTLKLEKDKDKIPFGFFVPAAKNKVGLSKTFIIDGIGYDLFPMSWERLEGLAALDGYNISCLGNAEILYCRSEEDENRFLQLQAKLYENLHSPQYMLNKALEKLNVAMEIFQTMLFEDALYKIRKASGHIIDFLSIAVACANQTYFKNAQTNQISDLSTMESIPNDFISLYQSTVNANSAEELKKLCYEMIHNTRQFLSEKKGKSETTVPKKNFKELADWYQELCYTWRRVYHWCDKSDAVRAFMWGCTLQTEFDIVREEFGLKEMNLLGEFAADDLTAYRKRAQLLEKQIVSVIEENGVVIEAYSSADDFIQRNS